MNEMKSKILLYKLHETEHQIISSYFADEYDVIDESSCFTDILAIPAIAIFLDPTKLSSEEWKQMNDIYSHDMDTQIVFTKKPDDPLTIKFSYYIEDDILNLNGKKMGLNESLELIKGYDAALESKNQLLSDIDSFLTPEEDDSAIDKTVKLQNGCMYFQLWYDLLCHVDTVPRKERVAFRSEMLNTMYAMQLAYGLIDVSDVVSFDVETSEDSEWIVSLAEMLKGRRKDYLTKGNKYYKPKSIKRGDENNG